MLAERHGAVTVADFGRCAGAMVGGAVGLLLLLLVTPLAVLFHIRYVQQQQQQN